MGDIRDRDPDHQSMLTLNVTDISFIEEHAISSYDTKTTESTITEYNQMQSLTASTEFNPRFTGTLRQISKQTNVQPTPFRVYKNDSGTEISFEPFSMRTEELAQAVND